MKKIFLIIPLIFLFIPLAKAEEYRIKFMNATFPSPTYQLDCVLARNRKIYCFTEYGEIIEYDSKNDSLRVVKNTGHAFRFAVCVQRPDRDTIHCAPVDGAGYYIFDTTTMNESLYFQPYRSWCGCNGTCWAYVTPYGFGCFYNKEYLRVNHPLFYPYGAYLCYGGRAGYPTGDYDICDLEGMEFTPSYPNAFQWPMACGAGIALAIDCVSYDENNSVCLGGNISNPEIKVSSNITYFRVSPDIWYWSCASPNEAQIITGKTYDKNVYCFGGYDNQNDKYVNKVYKFDTSNNTLTEFLTLPFTYYDGSCHPDENGEIYCFGGAINGTVTNKIFKLEKIVPPVKPACIICDYSQLNPNDFLQNLMILPCFLINVIFCNPLLFLFVIFALLIITIIVNAKRAFW
jgi:hypothetical protein